MCDERLPAGAKQAERAGVAVQEGGAADGADFAVAEEAPERHRPQSIAEELGVVIGAAEEVLPSTHTGEEQRPLWPWAPIVGQKALEILLGGACVTQEQLHHLPGLN